MTQPKSMQALVSWLKPLRRSEGPRYLQIVSLIERAISSGELVMGNRLPPQRRVAADLGIDLTTVTRAYDEAKRRGLIVARGAAGTYVSTPKIQLRQTVDLSMNIPPSPAGMAMEELLRRGLSQVLIRADADLLMTYHLGGGGANDRLAATKWLAPLLGKVVPDRVAISPGTQSALTALIAMLTRAKDVILADNLSYPGLKTAANLLGRVVASVPTDSDGIIPSELERFCLRLGSRLLYLNPTMHNPTAVTMPLSRRQDLAKVIRKLGLTVIEDDPYAPLLDVPPPAMAALIPDQVYYVSTLSKCIAPGLRIAFFVGPDVEATERFKAASRAMTLMPTAMMASLATFWINEGTAHSITAGISREIEARQDIALRCLNTSPLASRRSLHLWHPLPEHWTASQLCFEAKSHGLTLASADAFAIDEVAPSFIRISLGNAEGRAGLTQALMTLNRLIESKPSQDILI